MRFSIAGLCELMNGFDALLCAARGALTSDSAIDLLTGHISMPNAPSTISWGGNNRTAAIRIPASSARPETRHLEHRVPCSDADPALAIACIFIGIACGIRYRIPLSLDKEFGDAAAQKFRSPFLVRTLKEASEAYLASSEMRSRLQVYLSHSKGVSEEIHFAILKRAKPAQ